MGGEGVPAHGTQGILGSPLTKTTLGLSEFTAPKKTTQPAVLVHLYLYDKVPLSQIPAFPNPERAEPELTLHLFPRAAPRWNVVLQRSSPGNTWDKDKGTILLLPTAPSRRSSALPTSFGVSLQCPPPKCSPLTWQDKVLGGL